MRTPHTYLAFVALSQLMPPADARTVGRPRERTPPDSTRLWALDNTKHLLLLGVRATVTVHRGRKSVRLVESTDPTRVDRDRAVAFIEDEDFHDGTIELWVAGTIRPDAADTSVRGKTGVPGPIRVVRRHSTRRLDEDEGSRGRSSRPALRE
jgi:hypothetical protein